MIRAAEIPFYGWVRFAKLQSKDYNISRFNLCLQMASRYKLAPRKDAERQNTLFDAPRVRSYRNYPPAGSLHLRRCQRTDPWRGGRARVGQPMNQLDLNGRNAVVTGGASGLGFAIAERLVASGAKVGIWDLNGEAPHAAGRNDCDPRITRDLSGETSAATALPETPAVLPDDDT